MPSKSFKRGKHVVKANGGRTAVGGARDPLSVTFIPFLVSLTLPLTESLWLGLFPSLSVSDFIWRSWSCAWSYC